MPGEPIQVGGLRDFSDERKAKLIRAREPFQNVTPENKIAKGQLDHMNTFR